MKAKVREKYLKTIDKDICPYCDATETLEQDIISQKGTNLTMQVECWKCKTRWIERWSLYAIDRFKLRD